MTEKSCVCSEETRNAFGFREYDQKIKCNNCDGFIGDVQVEPKIEPERFDPTSLDLDSQTEIITRLMRELGENGKYHKVLSDGKFAAFSIVGTRDWEDYASLALRAVLLKQSLRIDQNLEEIKKILQKIEKKL